MYAKFDSSLAGLSPGRRVYLATMPVAHGAWKNRAQAGVVVGKVLRVGA
jgi:hypothetical protein